MNKHLLTLAGLFSLLVVNQAFGGDFMHRLNIKNETTNKQNLFVYFHNYGVPDQASIPAGGNMTLKPKLPLPLRKISLAANDEVIYTPKKDTAPKTVSQKNVTIKTVNGKTVIVENP